MILAFLAGAGVLSFGAFVGAALVLSSQDRILKSAPPVD